MLHRTRRPSSVHQALPAPKIVRHARTLTTVTGFVLRASVLKWDKAALGEWLSDELPTLGPTFVKIGQFISSRQDIFGEDFSRGFVRLRDAVPPICPTELHQLFSDALDIEGSFRSLDMVPIASASIGQVHLGVLKDGRAVVVKVKRPDIERLIKDDIAFIATLASAASMVNRSDKKSVDQAARG
jgi:ubiquinone biosynthesis protein